MNRLIDPFPAAVASRIDAVALLACRLVLGLSMVGAHGWRKLTGFEELSTKFPDPIGLGPVTSLSLAVFAEVFCSIALVLGAMTRLATVPLMVTMLVAVLVVHADDPFARKELGLIYLAGYLVLFARGAGALSLDALLARRRD